MGARKGEEREGGGALEVHQGRDRIYMMIDKEWEERDRERTRSW